MSDIDKLERTLRQQTPSTGPLGQLSHYHAGLFREAADALASLKAKVEDRYGPTTVAWQAKRQRDEAVARALAAEQRLGEVREGLGELIAHFERGDHHNAGAFDPRCADCVALEKARSLRGSVGSRAELNPPSSGGGA